MLFRFISGALCVFLVAFFLDGEAETHCICSNGDENDRSVPLVILYLLVFVEMVSPPARFPLNHYTGPHVAPMAFLPFVSL